MPRDYRSIGFAALVAAILLSFSLGAYWVSLGQPEQPNRYPDYQTGNGIEQGPSASVANVPVPIVERTPCHNPKSETESDLCAQWRAAKAAEKSADWTLYGVIASAIGISLLLWQIMLTREAVKDTGNATKAMEAANVIAREIGQTQIRCYLSISKATFLNSSLVGGTDGGLYCEIKNSGQSLAHNVRLEADFTYYNASKRTLRTQKFAPENVSFEFIVPSGADIAMRPILGPYALSKDEISAVNAGDMVCVEIEIRIFAKDVFGIECPASEFFIHHFTDKDRLWGKHEMGRMGQAKHW